MKQSFKSAGAKYIGSIGNREHVIRMGFNGDYTFEVWASNKNHASYGLTFKNTHLEFCRTATDREKFEAVI